MCLLLQETSQKWKNIIFNVLKKSSLSLHKDKRDSFFISLMNFISMVHHEKYLFPKRTEIWECASNIFIIVSQDLIIIIPCAETRRLICTTSYSFSVKNKTFKRIRTHIEYQDPRKIHNVLAIIQLQSIFLQKGINSNSYKK